VESISVHVTTGEGQPGMDREQMRRPGFSAQNHFRGDNVAAESRQAGDLQLNELAKRSTEICVV
jgi:hypothetical protein